jgi:AcrR family transcriptional regulator
MKATDGRKARGDRARAQILGHAILLASRDGLEHLSVGRLACEAGICKSNIQVLFGEKEALQLAVIEYGIAMYRRKVVEPALAQETPLSRLKALVEGWYAHVETRLLPGGCFMHALSYEYRTRPGPIRDRVEHYRKAARRRLIDLVQQAQAAGEIGASADAGQVALELTAFQSLANVAALMDDTGQFELARRMTRERLHALQSR